MKKYKKLKKSKFNTNELKHFQKETDFFGWEHGDFPYYNLKQHTGTGFFDNFIFIFFLILGYALLLFNFSIPFLNSVLALIVILAGYVYAYKKDFYKEFFHKNINLGLIVVFTLIAVVIGEILFLLLSMIYPNIQIGLGLLPENRLLTVFASQVLTIVGIIAEELLFVGIFILILTCMNYFLQINRKKMVLYTLISTSFIFGLLHIFTYQNIVQSLIVIGFTSCIIHIPYVINKNIWNTILIHFLYNTIILLSSLYLF
ncbi:hypothetical protein IGK74_002282 [Enterococcus sp. AZ150]|uniref:CPBP family intramembrane glutamic endopeptidase n=1 Tax=Enterococcus sp. AZ150 TaxID=2774866 RepID=UPI003F1E61AE